VKPVIHEDFLIVRYMLFLNKRGIPPFLSSIIFGGTFFLFGVSVFVYQRIPLSFGYLSCLSWLFIGPFLIFKARQMIDELWPNMLQILEEKKVRELQSYEKAFHSHRYLIIGAPAAFVVSMLVLLTHIFPIFSPQGLFYLVSWVVLALLGSLGVWGTVQLIMLVLAIRKCDLRLNPLSHDRFGGMEFLANFGIKATAMYSTGALMIPMAIESATLYGPCKEFVVFAIVGSGFFSLSVLFSFLIQVFAMNRAAVKGKKELLEKTGLQYDILLKQFEDKKDLEVGIRILVTQGLFDEISQMRVYPWDLGILLKLAGSVALPIILGTIKFWFPWIPMH